MMEIMSVLLSWRSKAQDDDGHIISLILIACDHYCRMLLTRHYDQRPFDETMCDALIANGDVKNVKKMQNVCHEGYIKHGSDFSCMCDARHTVQFN